MQHDDDDGGKRSCRPARRAVCRVAGGRSLCCPMKFRMGEKLSFGPWSAGPLLPVPRRGVLRWRVVLVVVPFAPVSAQRHGGGDTNSCLVDPVR